MAISVLDPKTALIVIDLQEGIRSIPGVHPFDEIATRAAALADTFRTHGLPVVLVNVDAGAPGRTEQTRSFTSFPDGWDKLVPELNQHPDDLTVTKRTWGAFTNTGLDERLKGLGVTQVVIVGISTSAGVESTARQAHECGFNVTLAVDAMTDRDLETHNHSTTRIFPRLGETGTTDEIIAALENASTSTATADSAAN